MESDLLREEKRLPKRVLDKAKWYSNEFGCLQKDFPEVIEAARKVPMGIIGGQVMYYLPDGTCELYWLSYDPKGRKTGEAWINYCNRTADECLEKFNTLISNVDIERDAIENFHFLKNKKKEGVNIDEYKIFLLYFNDSETDSFR